MVELAVILLILTGIFFLMEEGTFGLALNQAPASNVAAVSASVPTVAELEANIAYLETYIAQLQTQIKTLTPQSAKPVAGSAAVASTTAVGRVVITSAPSIVNVSELYGGWSGNIYISGIAYQPSGLPVPEGDSVTIEDAGTQLGQMTTADASGKFYFLITPTQCVNAASTNTGPEEIAGTEPPCVMGITEQQFGGHATTTLNVTYYGALSN